jgi:hypothetical protein
MFAPMWGNGVKRGRDEVATARLLAQDGMASSIISKARPIIRAAKRSRSGPAAQMAVAMEDVLRPVAAKVLSSLPGVRQSTYCLKQKKKTGNVNARIDTITVKGRTRYQLKSSCAECGAKKCSFLTAAKTGGRLH